MAQLTADVLLNIGFRDVAKWARTTTAKGTIQYCLDGPNAESNKSLLGEPNALYAFVFEDVDAEGSSTVANADPSAAPVNSATQPAGKFQIALGSAYYSQGLVNPGVEASRLLGEDGDQITIYLGDESEQVHSTINRRANANGSVRVVGDNRSIACWFQANFKLTDTVEARVLDAHHVLLLRPL